LSGFTGEEGGLMKALEIKPREVITGYGAGGKTTLLTSLSRELFTYGCRVILTTTTAMYSPERWPLVTNSCIKQALHETESLLRQHRVVVMGSSLTNDGKVLGVDPEWIEELYRCSSATHILVEADGARSLSLKGYHSHEPVVPSSTTLLLPVLGLQGLGKPLDQRVVHRPGIFSRQCGAKPGEHLSINNYIAAYSLMIKRGKSQSPKTRIVPVANQADSLPEISSLTRMGKSLFQYSRVERMIFTSLRPEARLKPPVRLVLAPEGGSRPRVSSVILAAGLSHRMGNVDKLFLDLKGKTVLEHSLDAALHSSVDEVVVVVKPRDLTRVRYLVRNKQVKVVENPNYQRGMSSTLKAGLEATAPIIQGVIFTLGDQPGITSRVYNKITEVYRNHLPLAVSPVYQGQRGNPVLFDRRTWPRLMELEGDTGGKGVLSTLSKEQYMQVEVEESQVLQDLDTPADYHVMKGKV